MSEFPEMMGLLISWALADSVDPCIFALFVSILTSASLIGVRSVVKIGVSFITATFVGYVIFGFLLRTLAGGLPRWLMGLAALVYGLASLFSVIRGRESKRTELVCREDELPCRIVNALDLNRISRAEVLPTVALGLIASFTLLPCSAGLYILYNVIMSQYGLLIWLPLTILYVTIFEIPLITILLAFIGASRLKTVNEFLLSKEKLVRVLGAVMMITVSLYILLTY